VRPSRIHAREKKPMKASSIILAKLFEHIELKMIFELCLKLKRIMLGFFDTLQKFLGEVSMQGARDRER
jgi:hypothetical protein